MLGRSRTKISDAGLENVKNGTDLEGLSLEGAPVSDEGVAKLIQLPKLSSLSLAGTVVTTHG
jgi:hypothetical protein